MSIEFDWAALDKQPLPLGQHPKTWPSWGLPRTDGRDVDMESMHQFYIYGGDLLGAMYHPRKKLSSITAKALELYQWVKADPVIIPPVLMEYSHPNQPQRLPTSASDIGTVTLPRVAVIAALRSGRVARDSSCCFSSLVVIWFQESFGDASSATLEQVAAIDWDALAFDWMP